MAQIVVTDSARFPEGTTVNAYPRSNWPTPQAQADPSGADPVGASAGSAAVSSGSATITGLTNGVTYWLYASVGGQRRYELAYCGPENLGDVAHLNAASQEFTGANVFDNDPTIPSLPTPGQKAALPGSSGTPGAGNKYVTDADARNSDKRTPTDAAFAAILAVPRRVITGQILLSNAAAAATNYFAATYATAVNPSGTAPSAFPGSGLAKWSLDPTLFPAIAAVNPLLRLRAITDCAGTNPNYTLTIGLYPYTIVGGVITPGTIVAGSSTTHAVTAGNNRFITTTTSGIALPASGVYVPVATIDGAPAATNPTQITVDVYYG